MATGPEMLRAVYGVCRPFSIGSEVSLSDGDVLDLCKLVKQDLVAFGFSDKDADATVKALGKQNITVLGEWLGLTLTTNPTVPTLEESQTAFRAAGFCLALTMRLCRYVLQVAQYGCADSHALNTARSYHIQLQTALRYAQQSLNARIRDRLYAVCRPIDFDDHKMMRHEIVLHLAGNLIEAIRVAGRELVGPDAGEPQLAEAIYNRWAEINPLICDRCLDLLQKCDREKLTDRLETEYRAIHVKDALL